VVPYVKENVSLGVGSLVKRNEALLGKWLYRFEEERDCF
jgi:hypothetical protein